MGSVVPVVGIGCDSSDHLSRKWQRLGRMPEVITEKGNGDGQKSQSKLSSNANDFTFLLEETGLIEQNTSIPGEPT